MNKNLLLLLLLPTTIIPAQPNPYGLTKGTSIFPVWPTKAKGYDAQVKEAPYQQDNPPISRAPSKIWGKNTKPFPTNRWFTTLAISGDIAYTSDNTPSKFVQPFSVITFPYIIQALINGTNQQNQAVYPGLNISLPEKQFITEAGNQSTAFTCQENYCNPTPLDTGTIPTPQGGTMPDYSFTAGLLNITPYNAILSCQEQENLEDPMIDPVNENDPFDVNKNLFGVKLLFKLRDEKPKIKKERFSTFLVRGMPFISTEFENLTPMLQFPGQAILRFATLQNNTLTLASTEAGSELGALTGTEFIVQLNNNQSWFIFSQTPITLNCITGAGSSAQETASIIATTTTTGLIQIINYTIPQIQPPAIPTPLPVHATPPTPSWKSITPSASWTRENNPLTNYQSYEQYFTDNFFPAVQDWYENTYLGSQYYDKMPPLELPKNPHAADIYNYYMKNYLPELKNSHITHKPDLNQTILDALTKLQSYSGIYPTGGTVQLSNTENDPTLTINWTTNIPVTANKPLLLLTLPHHQQLLSQNKKYWDENITYDSIRGQLLGFLGTTWTLNYQNPGVSWYCKDPNGNINNAEVQAKIIQYLEQENVTITSTDSYGFGKEIARLARLALIAHQIKQPTQTVQAILDVIKKSLKPWIPVQPGISIPKNADPLYYDEQWGGICTQNGLLSHEQDYGMGWYNDHHFHFGYFIYAAAVYLYLSDYHQESDSKFDPQLIQFTRELIKDIANPNTDDESYPHFRLMDWYLGHSLAAGIFPFSNGKNQESTSEAVNAWYGIYLFGVATKNNYLQNLGNTLMAAEINAAQTYWYMMPGTAEKPSINSEIYPSIYSQLGCVGVLWETKADYATFFGTNVEYINLIHFLPFTPATEALIPQAWNTYQYEGPSSIDPLYQDLGLQLGLKSSLTRTINPVTKQPDPIESSWRGFVHMSQAISDPKNAFLNFTTDINSKLQPFDNGNSATNTLYWHITRPSFTPNAQQIPQYAPSQPVPTPSPPPAPQPTPAPSAIPVKGKIIPGLPASPQTAESMGYAGATQSIAAYVDYIKTNYLQGVINWWMQTHTSTFPRNISLSFSGSNPQDVFNGFASSDFYQTLVKHYNKYKNPYFHIPVLPAGKTRPPLPSMTSNINDFIKQTFIPTWYEPNLGNYKGYTSVPAEQTTDQYYEFLVNIYAPAYLKWIQMLQKNK